MIINILGNDWKVYLFEEEFYIQKLDDSTAAQTMAKSHEIYFNEAELSRDTVTHELCHAFFHELCVGSANLNPGQVEEVMADMFGKYGNKILALSRKLYKELKSEEGQTE